MARQTKVYSRRSLQPSGAAAESTSSKAAAPKSFPVGVLAAPWPPSQPSADSSGCKAGCCCSVVAAAEAAGRGQRRSGGRVARLAAAATAAARPPTALICALCDVPARSPPAPARSCTAVLPLLLAARNRGPHGWGAARVLYTPDHELGAPGRVLAGHSHFQAAAALPNPPSAYSQPRQPLGWSERRSRLT